MQINPISNKTISGGMNPAAMEQSGAAGQSFTNTLGSVMNQLGAVEQNSTSAVEALASGEPIDIHDVVLATETESLAFNLMLNIRNKLVEAYQEVFRMQI